MKKRTFFNFIVIPTSFFLGVLTFTFSGCNDESDEIPSVTASEGFSVSTSAVSKQNFPYYWGSKMYLIEVKNYKTGKTHLIGYIGNSEGKAMVKLEEY